MNSVTPVNANQLINAWPVGTDREGLKINWNKNRLQVGPPNHAESD